MRLAIETPAIDGLLLVILIVFAAIGALTFVLAVYVMWDILYYQAILAPGLERDLGFRRGKAYLPDPGERGYASAVAIDSVVEGGVFQQAGFREGDVLPDYSPTDLFKWLHRHRGRTATIAVVDGGAGPPFQRRPRRDLQLVVPPRRRNVDRARP